MTKKMEMIMHRVAVYLLLSCIASSHATVLIPDVPLYMNSTGVKPNFVITLDDSGSMQWGYVPDSRSSELNTNRIKSSYYNGIYYDPNVQYFAPPKYNMAVGSLSCPLTSNLSDCYPNASFTNAPLNGFDTTRGSVNLDTDYRAISSYSPSNTTQSYTGSPSGSSDRTYYGASTSSATLTTISARCTVFFDSRSGAERINISNCSPAVGFNSGDNGDALTVQCLSSDGCSGLNSRYLNAVNGNGDPIPYTITYSSSNQISVGEQPQWSSDKSEDKVRLTWVRSTGTATTYPAYYYMFYSQTGGSKPVACTSTLSSQKTDDNCYIKYVVGTNADVYKNPDGSVATTASKQQNFANWYSYYRTRNLAMVTGTHAALNGLDGSVRVAWQAINTCNTFGATACKGWNNPSTGLDNRMRAIDQVVSGTETHRQQMYSWLSRFPASGGTPLRTAAINAGKYFDTTLTTLSSTSPWAENPPGTAGTYYSCRRSVHLLMTDGIWNTDSVSSINNATNGPITLPAGSGFAGGATWTPTYPFPDSNSNSIADIAMYYWSKDLAPTIDNKITAYFADRSGTSTDQWNNPRNDPANWQHLSTHAISLGLSSVLVTPSIEWGGSTYSGGYSALKSGATWPTTGSNLAGNAYDLWHAALVGRGQFYSAESGDSLKTAFKNVVDSVSSLASAGGGAGLTANSTKVTTTTAVYLATYNGDWSGSFQAIPVQNDGSLATLSWDAGQLVPYAANRNIYTNNDGTAQAFKSCTGSLATALNSDIVGTVDNRCSQRLAWLRGFLQVTGASWSPSTNKATFTVPENGLASGDTVVIANVTPSQYNGTYSNILVSGNAVTVSLPLSSDPGSMSNATTGTARVAEFRSRVSPLGDIMNSTPTYSHTDDYGYGVGSSGITGKSTYGAYVLSKASRTPIVYVGANDGMLHAFGGETVGASAGKELFAFVPSTVYSNLSKLSSPLYSHKFYVDGSPTVGDVYLNSSWKTFLVGGLGAGGKSVYALDVSNASDFAKTTFNGATFSPSTLVKWEFTDTDLGLTMSQPLIAPNTQSQWAVIFGNGYNSSSDRAYLYVVDPATGTLISKVAAGSYTSNGLSAPYLYDKDGDKIPDVAYAGDLYGNLWKFVNTAGNWSLGNGGNALFTAKSSGGIAQPITSAPRSLPHPNGGIMIFFGTGRYFSNSDLTDSTQQAFYGVWDKDITVPTIDRSKLQPQTLTTTGTSRTVTGVTPTWSTQSGCYIDLPSGSPSERILSSPLAKQFSTIDSRLVFTTSTPTSDACDRGGSSWLMELSSICGSLSAPVLDTNGDGVINSSDAVAAGIKLPDTVGITLSTPPLWLDGDDKYGYKYITGSKGVPLKVKQTRDPDPITPAGVVAPVRVYWKQIL